MITSSETNNLFTVSENTQNSTQSHKRSSPWMGFFVQADSNNQSQLQKDTNNITDKRRKVIRCADDQRMSAEQEFKLRSEVGGKGFFLTLMKKFKLTVPDFQVIETSVIAAIENIAIDQKLLKEYIPSIEKLTHSEATEASLADIKAAIADPDLQPESKARYLKSLSQLIASDDFYLQVKNHKAVQSIRDTRHNLPVNRPIIARSSGVTEDSYGDSQAGKYDSLVQGEEDIVQTCLKVMASGYRPEICQQGVPATMAIILQECIDCQYGGVVMSYRTLQDNTIRIEYAPGQPKGVVAGLSGNTPHRYDLSRGDQGMAKAINTPGHSTTSFILKKRSSGYQEEEVIHPESSDLPRHSLNDSHLQKLYKDITRLEDWLLCPVDVEFGISQQGKLFLFQVRPITQLPGGTQFKMTQPDNPLVKGELVSEGCCSGPVVLVSEKQPESFPNNAIIVSHHCQDWMPHPDILRRVGGFVFKQGGTNDHIAILLRQYSKPCLLAGDQYKEALPGGKTGTLVCGSFNQTPQGYLLEGDQAEQLQHKMATKPPMDAVLNENLSVPTQLSEQVFNQPDTGFKWLNEQNTRLLDYFHTDRLLHCCLSPIHCLQLSMAANREELIARLIDEFNHLFVDSDQFLQGYQLFLLSAGKNSEFAESSYHRDLEKLKARYKGIKEKVQNNLNVITKPFISRDKPPASNQFSFSSWLKSCRDLQLQLQSLNKPKSVEQIDSIHDLIFWIHSQYIAALYDVVINSGKGKVSEIEEERCRFIDLTSSDGNFTCPNDRNFLRDIIEKTLSKNTHFFINAISIDEGAILNWKPGNHVCSIEMLNEAEAAKGKIVRLRFSDKYQEKRFNDGNIKRFFLLVKNLKDQIPLSDDSGSMAINLNKTTGTITIEYSHLSSIELMKTIFSTMLSVINSLDNMDTRLERCIFNVDNFPLVWDFSVLKLAIDNVAPSNQFLDPHDDLDKIKTILLNSTLERQIELLRFLFAYKPIFVHVFIMEHDKINLDCLDGKEYLLGMLNSTRRWHRIKNLTDSEAQILFNLLRDDYNSDKIASLELIPAFALIPNHIKNKLRSDKEFAEFVSLRSFNKRNRPQIS